MCYTYKALTLFFSLLLLPPFFVQAQAETPIQSPSVTINPSFNPNFNPEFNNAPTYKTTIRPIMYYNPTSINYLVGQKIHNFSITCYDKVTETITKENYNHATQLLKQLLWKSRYALASGTLAGAYSSIGLLLLVDYNFLMNGSLWSHWKHECSFADLCTIPAKELEKALIHDIAQRNCNRKNPIDIVHPLIDFINTIDTEIYRIQRYITIASLIKKFRLTTIFPTNDAKIESAQKILERAHFVRHIFLSWLADYNLTIKN